MNAVEKPVGAKLEDDLSQHPRRIGGVMVGTEGLIVEFRSVQILQKFEVHVRLFKTALEINEDIITSLKALNSDLRELATVQDQDGKIAWRSVNASLEQQQADILCHKRNVDCLISQIQGRSQLVRHLFII